LVGGTAITFCDTLLINVLPGLLVSIKPIVGFVILVGLVVVLLIDCVTCLDDRAMLSNAICLDGGMSVDTTIGFKFSFL